MQNNAIRQTSKWQLRGATYKENDSFYFVGDVINEHTQLVFDVNGAHKTVKVPAPLKSLSIYYDEIKNGVVHYNIKSFEVNQHTILAIDTSWLQTDQTAICYCHLPYEARSNTPILCDKLNIVSGMITKTEDCGVKVINKILALRLPIKALGITPNDNQDTYLNKFNAYLKENPFTILYCLMQSDSQLLEDYSFDIRNADNDITCQTHYAPSYFNVDYPVDVIINTTVDVKEVQQLAEQVKATKVLIDVIKEDLDDKTAVTTEQYHLILKIQEHINTQTVEIDKMYKIVTDSTNKVSEALVQINQLKQEVAELAEEIRTIAQEVNAAINVHNTSGTSHQDIRALINQSDSDTDGKIQRHNINDTAHKDIRDSITELESDCSNNIAIHNASTESHRDIRLQIEEINNKINFDFGNY